MSKKVKSVFTVENYISLELERDYYILEDLESNSTVVSIGDLGNVPLAEILSSSYKVCCDDPLWVVECRAVNSEAGGMLVSCNQKGRIFKHRKGSEVIVTFRVNSAGTRLVPIGDLKLSELSTDVVTDLTSNVLPAEDITVVEADSSKFEPVEETLTEDPKVMPVEAEREAETVEVFSVVSTETKSQEKTKKKKKEETKMGEVNKMDAFNNESNGGNGGGVTGEGVSAAKLRAFDSVFQKNVKLVAFLCKTDKKLTLSYPALKSSGDPELVRSAPANLQTEFAAVQDKKKNTPAHIKPYLKQTFGVSLKESKPSKPVGVILEAPENFRKVLESVSFTEQVVTYEPEQLTEGATVHFVMSMHTFEQRLMDMGGKIYEHKNVAMDAVKPALFEVVGYGDPGKVKSAFGVLVDDKIISPITPRNYFATTTYVTTALEMAGTIPTMAQAYIGNLFNSIKKKPANGDHIDLLVNKYDCLSSTYKDMFTKDDDGNYSTNLFTPGGESNLDTVYSFHDKTVPVSEIQIPIKRMKTTKSGERAEFEKINLLSGDYERSLSGEAVDQDYVSLRNGFGPLAVFDHIVEIIGDRDMEKGFFAPASLKAKMGGKSKTKLLSSEDLRSAKLKGAVEFSFSPNAAKKGKGKGKGSDKNRRGASSAVQNAFGKKPASAGAPAPTPAGGKTSFGNKVDDTINKDNKDGNNSDNA